MSIVSASKIDTKVSKSHKTELNTAAGKFETAGKTQLSLKLPELSNSATINYDFHVHNKKLCHYNMIIGRDLINKIGLDLCGSNQTVKWPDKNTYMPYKDLLSKHKTSFFIKGTRDIKEASNRMLQILDAKYSKADVNKIVSNIKMLNDLEQNKLLSVLERHESLFDETLGRWTGDPYKITLKEGVQPYYVKPFSVPHAYESILKAEVERLCKIGVLKRVNCSEWASPSFIIPKKDVTVRFINDFRELNKRIKRTPYPIPKIQVMLLKLEGFQYATSLDLNMGYYHIQLHPDSKKLCTLVFLWGKYEMQVLPMGLCNEPDIFQEKMSRLFTELEYIRIYNR